MPLDGTNFYPSVVDLFDAMLEFFGPDGDRWTTGEQVDRHGNRCLVGALRGCRAKLAMTSRQDMAAFYLRRAITKYISEPGCSIIDFNNSSYTKFNDIHAVIMMARRIADLSVDPRQLKFVFKRRKARKKKPVCLESEWWLTPY